MHVGFKIFFEDGTEYAKDMVWEERFNIFQDQIYILGKQNRKLLRLAEKVDWVLTDSPIIMGIAYMVDTPYNETLKQLILEVFNGYDNLNIFVNRNHGYQELCRNQNEQEADNLAMFIKGILIGGNIPYIDINSNEITPKKLLKLIKNNR